MKIKYIIVTLTCVLTLWACNDPRDNNMIDPMVYFRDNGVIVTPLYYDVEPTFDYTTYICVSGLDGVNATVSVKADEQALSEYNNQNSTSLEALPQDCYQILNKEVNVSKQTRNGALNLRFNSANIKALGDISKYVLPLTITSGGAAAVSLKGLSAFIHPNQKEADVMMSENGVHEYDLDNIDPNQPIEINFKVYTEFENKWGCDLEMIHGQQSLDICYQNNEEAPQIASKFISAPADCYTLESVDKLPVGTDTVNMKLTIYPSKLPTTDIFSVGVTIKSASFKVDPAKCSIVARFSKQLGTQSPRAGWVNTYFNSHGSGKMPALMLDGNPNTFWEAAYNSAGTGIRKLPFILDFDMTEIKTLCGLGIIRRNDDRWAKDCKGGYYEVSTDNVTWHRVGRFNYGNSIVRGPLVVPFEKIDARYIRLVITDVTRVYPGNDVASVAEIYAYVDAN